jgi:hypothetical protein
MDMQFPSAFFASCKSPHTVRILKPSDLCRSSNTVRVVQSMKLRWTGHVNVIDPSETRNEERIFLIKHDGNRPLEGPSSVREEIINIWLKELGNQG